MEFSSKEDTYVRTVILAGLAALVVVGPTALLSPPGVSAGNLTAAVVVVVWERDSSYFISTRTHGSAWVTHNQELSWQDNGEHEESSRVYFDAPSYAYRDMSGRLYPQDNSRDPYVRLTRMKDGSIQGRVCYFTSPTGTRTFSCRLSWSSDSGHRIDFYDHARGGWKRSKAIAVQHWLSFPSLDREPESYVIYGDASDEVLAEVESRLVAAMEWMDREYDLTPLALVTAGVTHGGDRGCANASMWFSADHESCYRSRVVVHEYVHALERSLHPPCYTGTCWWGNAPRQDPLPDWLQNLDLGLAGDGTYGTYYKSQPEGWATEGVASYFESRYAGIDDDCGIGRRWLDGIYEAGRDRGPHGLGYGLVCELLHLTGVPPSTLLDSGTFDELFGLRASEFYVQVRERIEARIEASLAGSE